MIQYGKLVFWSQGKVREAHFWELHLSIQMNEGRENCNDMVNWIFWRTWMIGIISEMFAQNTNLSKIIFVAYQALMYASLYYTPNTVEKMLMFLILCISWVCGVARRMSRLNLLQERISLLHLFWELNCLMECNSWLLVIASKEPWHGAGSKNKNYLMHSISKLH